MVAIGFLAKHCKLVYLLWGLLILTFCEKYMHIKIHITIGKTRELDFTYLYPIATDSLIIYFWKMIIRKFKKKKKTK